MKRASIYSRVSTADGKQSTSMQNSDLEEYASRRGFELVCTYEDYASGSDINRPAFTQMMKAARQRDFEILLVWKLDRLGRSLKDLVLTINELNELGIEIIFLKDNLDLTTSVGKLIVNIFSSLAEFELDLIKTRTKAGIAHYKKKNGRWGRPKSIDANEVSRLRAEGLSYSAIAKKLKISKSSVQNSLKLDHLFDE